MDGEKQNSVNPTRRRLFKAVLGGGALFAGASALPERWVRPMVQAVIVPAHAQLSNMYVPAAGAAVPTTISQNDTGGANRFAQALGEAIPTAHAFRLAHFYVCVTPNSDGTKADIKVFKYGNGEIEPCAGKPIIIFEYVATDVPVPSEGNPLVYAQTCPTSTVMAPAGEDTENLVERLGIIRSAQADLLHTVDISSVTNGAVGIAHLDGGITTVPFNIGPGSCLGPACCNEPD
jgi:hypothetical protein